MLKSKIKFGTDGWRGVIADDFTLKMSAASHKQTADYWNAQRSPKKAIVG